MKKENLITILIILGILIIGLGISLYDSTPNQDPDPNNQTNNQTQNNSQPNEFITCLSDNSKLYTQKGCHACERQKEILGKDYEYINEIDCWVQRDKCLNNDITATPTWTINGKKYIGVQTIQELKEISGCP